MVRIVNAINNLASKYIKWPRGADLERTKREFRAISQFDDLVGVVDGTYIPVKAPKAQMKSYTNRKCFTSMTLQAVCDSNLRYIDCYTGWPSSVPDVRIFKNSHLFNNVNQDVLHYFPNGEYIFGDKAYPVMEWCIPPYIRRHGRPISQMQTRFNGRQASVRQVIERSFALLFGRFRRLRYLDMNRIDWMPAVILACCVLHNICIIGNDDNLEAYIVEGEEVRIRNEILNDVNGNRNNDENAAINKRDRLCNQMR